MGWKRSYRHDLHGQKACKTPISQTRSRLSLAGLDLECTMSLKLQQPRYNSSRHNSNKLSTITQCTLITTLVQALIACIQLQVKLNSKSNNNPKCYYEEKKGLLSELLGLDV